MSTLCLVLGFKKEQAIVLKEYMIQRKKRNKEAIWGEGVCYDKKLY